MTKKYGMKLYPLFLGTMCSDSLYLDMSSTCATPANPEAPHKMVTTPSIAFLIDHPEAGYIVYDTGMADDPATAWPQWMHETMGWDKPVGSTMVEQLALVGVKPEDVKYVITSHHHFDHIGGDVHFADTADFIVSKADADIAYEQAMSSPDDTGYYLKDEVLLARKSIRYLDGDVKNLFPGIDAYIMPGHTPGVLTLMVHLDGGSVFLAEDAVNVASNLEQGAVPGGAYDSLGQRVSIARIRNLVEKQDARVFYGHDIDQFNRMKKAPEYYA